MRRLVQPTGTLLLAWIVTACSAAQKGIVPAPGVVATDAVLPAGKLPVSIPPYSRYGDGLMREARRPGGRRTP